MGFPWACRCLLCWTASQNFHRYRSHSLDRDLDPISYERVELGQTRDYIVTTPCGLGGGGGGGGYPDIQNGVLLSNCAKELAGCLGHPLTVWTPPHLL